MEGDRNGCIPVLQISEPPSSLALPPEQATVYTQVEFDFV